MTAIERQFQFTREALSAELGKVLDFMRLLWALDHALQTKSKLMVKELGVTGLQRIVIRIIGQFPGIAAGQVAEIIHVHPSTLTGVFALLEVRRVVERKVDPNDGRRVLFQLAPLGRKLNNWRQGTIETCVEQALAKIPATKLAAACDVLNELTAALSNVESGK